MGYKPIKNLGEKIQSDLESMGLNDSAIARKMGVNRQTINQIATRKTFDLLFLQKLKDASGLDYTNYVFDAKRNGYIVLPTKTQNKTTEQLMQQVINLQQKNIELLEENNRLKLASL